MINTTNIDKNGELDKKAKIGTCQFPFKYYRKDRYECIEGKSKKGKWCATELKPDNTYKHFGYCVLNDKSTSTEKKASKQENIVTKKTKKEVKSKLLKSTSNEQLNGISFHIKKEINTIDEVIYYQLHLYYKINEELTFYNTSNVSEYQYDNVIGNFYDFVWGYNHNGFIQFEPYKYSYLMNTTNKEMIDLLIQENPIDYNIILTQFKKHQSMKTIETEHLFLNVSKNEKVLINDISIDHIKDIFINKKKEPYIKVFKNDALYSFNEFQSVSDTLLTSPGKKILTYKCLLNGDYVGVLNYNQNQLLYLGRVKKEIPAIFKDTTKNETIFIENAIYHNETFRKTLSTSNTNILFLNQEQITLYEDLIKKYIITQRERYNEYKSIFQLHDTVILKSQPDIGSFKIISFTIWSDLERDNHIGEDLNISYNNIENPYTLSVSYDDIEKIEADSNSPKYTSVTPEYNPDSSDYEYVPSNHKRNSPMYDDDSPTYKIDSPKYESDSPKYDPNSPMFHVNSSPESSSEKVVDLIKSDIYNKLGIHKHNPILYGWEYIGDDMENIGGERYVSLILDNKGQKTDIWELEMNEYKTPLHYVKGWKQDELYYKNGDRIPNLEVINYLKNNQVPNNWDKMIKKLSNSKVVKLPPIPSPPDYNYLQISTPTKSSSSVEYLDIVNPELNIIPYDINTKYDKPLILNDKVMVKHGIYNPLNGLIGTIIQMNKDKIMIDPEKGILDKDGPVELFLGDVQILDSDKPVELFIEDVIQIEIITISNYWNRILSSSPLINQNFIIKNCENRFFNTIYSHINNEFIDNDDIIINSNTGIPIYDIDKLNPMLKSDRLSFIRRGRIINKNIDGYIRKYRLWYIYSKNEYSDKINIFYFNYNRILKSNTPPTYGWYGSKDRQGKNIHLNFNNIDENLKLFSPSRLAIFSTKKLPIKTQYKKEIKCLNCDSSIHTIDNCPKKPRTEMTVCSICHKKGHWTEFCPSKNKIKKISSELKYKPSELKETIKKISDPPKANKLSVKNLALLKKASKK